MGDDVIAKFACDTSAPMDTATAQWVAVACENATSSVVIATLRVMEKVAHNTKSYLRGSVDIGSMSHIERPSCTGTRRAHRGQALAGE